MSVFVPALFALLLVPQIGAAASCARAPSYDVQLSKQAGDVYNQVASDGDELWPSYFAKATYRDGRYAFTVLTHRSQYDTQHAGSATDTVVHTISGSTVAVPWFVADERTSEARIEGCTRILGFYAGLSYLQMTSNYGYPIGYGPLRGPGVGIERFADPNRHVDAFAALFFYPGASGTYGNSVLSFQDTTFDGGVRWRPGASHLAVIAGLYQEIRAIPGIRSAQTVRAAPYLGISFSR